MRELQLVGYTADLLHLVFTDAEEGGGRFKAPIDDDFVATLVELLDLVDPETVPLGALVAGRPAVAEPVEAAAQDDDADTGEIVPEPERLRGVGPLAGMAAAVGPETDDGQTPAPERARPSKLAPREIQALLRAGQGTRSVAKMADTDERWVRRWLAPIEAERDQVLQAVWSSFVAKTRLGVSAEPVGEAVERNLAAKGVHTDDPSVEWIAARREGDTHWKVTLRYRSRGRAQRATWHFNPETGSLDPRNDLAVDVAWTRRRGGKARADGSKGAASRTGTRGKKSRTKKSTGKKKSAAKKSTAKKSTAKKSAAKKSAAKKSAAKESAAKESAAKESTAKKSAAKKSAAKKSAAKKSTAKKSTAKKSTAKKSTAKKSTAKKSAAKKSAAKTAGTKTSAAEKSAAKKSTAKKSTAKKSAAKKSAAKTAGTKTSGAKTSTAKESAAKKSATKKSAAKKSAAKKSAAKKSAAKKSAAPASTDLGASAEAPAVDGAGVAGPQTGEQPRDPSARPSSSARR